MLQSEHEQSAAKLNDVIVIGAGAAGLMAAASCAEHGRRVLVLEKNRKVGVKILMSGGTRCNITHNTDARGIAEAFGRQGKFLRSALAALPPEEVIHKIESLGVATKVESTGKIFPISNKAIDVRDALVTLATNAGATIATEQPVRRIESIAASSEDTNDSEARFRVLTDTQCYEANSVIITTGGKSYPGCGTTGDGYAWAEQFGHSIVRTVPALAPVACDEDWVHELSGITIEDCELSIYPVSMKRKQKPLDVRRGPLLFTHFGFSGPTAMNISRTIARNESDGNGKPEELTLRCDFLPTVTAEGLSNRFEQQKQTAGKETAAQLLSPFFPRRLAESLLDQATIPPERKNAELTKSHLVQLVETVKRTNFPVHTTLGYKRAEVTAGGVNLKEVDSRNMQSKLHEGLFLAGEILDVDGPIGGFNLQAAFSTGWLAGQHA